MRLYVTSDGRPGVAVGDNLSATRSSPRASRCYEGAHRIPVDKLWTAPGSPQQLLTTLWARAVQAVENCPGAAFGKGSRLLPKFWAFVRGVDEELPERIGRELFLLCQGGLIRTRQGCLWRTGDGVAGS